MINGIKDIVGIKEVRAGAILLWEKVQTYAISPSQNLETLTTDRNSAATYIDDSGIIQTAGANELRIDHSTGEPMLLVEGQSTNLIPDSVNMSSWAAFNNSVAYTPNVAIAPDGTGSANLLEFTSEFQSRFEKATGTQNLDRVFSIYLKSPEGAKEMRIGWGIGFTIPVLVTEKWQMFFMSRLASETGQYVRVQNETGEPQSILVWGAQVEKDRLIPSSYIPTNGSTVTRLADVITTTPPSGTTEIKETFADGTVNSITTIPATYQLPVGQIKKVEML